MARLVVLLLLTLGYSISLTYILKTRTILPDGYTFNLDPLFQVEEYLPRE